MLIGQCQHSSESVTVGPNNVIPYILTASHLNHDLHLFHLLHQQVSSLYSGEWAISELRSLTDSSEMWVYPQLFGDGSRNKNPSLFFG